MENNNYCADLSTSEKKDTIKNKKPFFLKWWFIALVIITAVFSFVSLKSGGEKVVWSDMVLGEMLPEPTKNKGEIHENSSDKLWVTINGISQKQYTDYVEKVKNKGYIVEEKTESNKYNAYNEDGYKLSVGLDYNDHMSIELEKPLTFSEISWPQSTAGNLLPIPKSLQGKFSYEHDDDFFVYIGNTAYNDYNNYLDECSQKGFNIDYNKGDNYYYAYNKDGWYLSLCYEGNNVMSISIKLSTNQPSTAQNATEKSGGEGLNPDFKKAMDSYEKFMDEYIAFMTKYKDNPSDMSLLSDYNDYIQKYTDMCDEFNKWNSEDMSDEELKYYIEVQARVSEKMITVSQ